jgi:hypothetical protein
MKKIGKISRDRSAAMEDQQMPRPPTPAFAQAVRQVLGIDDLIPRPAVVIPALRDPVTGPRIEAAHQAILASHACRIADAAAMRMRAKLAARKPEHPPRELEELVASEWACWFEEQTTGVA